MNNEEMVRQLVSLGELRTAGALSDAEFEQAKALVLATADAGTAAPTRTSTAAVPAGGGAPSSSGAVTVAMGGAIAALIAFIAMPIASAGFLGSVTGLQALNYGKQLDGIGWLVVFPIAALAAGGISAWQRWGAPPVATTQRAASTTVLVVAATSVIVHLVFLGQLSSMLVSSRSRVDLTALLGIGFWCGLLAILVTAVAGAAGIAQWNRRTLGPAR